MKEITFRNRIPVYPGRVIMTPVAGQANTYDMVRADEPTEEGTPLNKTAFDSIIQSRLTGRYYIPTVVRNTVSSNTGLTVNPIPTSGWSGSTSTEMTSGSYTATASGVDGAYDISRAFDGTTDNYWQSNSSTTPWLQLKFPSAVKVKKMKLRFTQTYSYSITLYVQGSTDGTSWTNLFSRTSEATSFLEFTMTTTGDFLYYRLYFVFGGESQARVYEWQLSEYDVNTYANAYTVASGFPTVWDVGQRVFLQVPTTANTFAVVSNTLNGVSLGTVLQSSKRYELWYNGSSFTVKEV